MNDLPTVLVKMRERLNNILRFTNDYRVAKEAAHALDRLILIEAEQKRIKNEPRHSYAKAMQYARDMGLPTEFPLPEAEQKRTGEMVLLPREPNGEMVEAFYRAYERPLNPDRWESHFSNAWEALIAAAENPK